MRKLNPGLKLVVIMFVTNQASYASNGPWVDVKSFDHQLVKVIAVHPAVSRKGEAVEVAQQCTGLLVSSTQVITAAHCLNANGITSLEVFTVKNQKYLGQVSSIELGRGYGKPADSNASESGQKKLTYQIGDIARFSLETQVSFPSRTVRMSKSLEESSRLSQSGDCKSVGFGKPDTQPKTKIWSETRDLALKMISHGFKITPGNPEVVANHYSIAPELFLSTPRQLTHGDSGGPVICKDEEGTSVLVAVNSSYADLFFDPLTPNEIGQFKGFNFFVAVSEESVFEAKTN